ncbi:TPA: hypothetical protein ACO6US_003823 [Escherichia albertii]|nr:hypothetical protein [Escherichia albertii]MCZ9121954.1 hypothetical protein [Escherichia albertii]
MMFIALIGIILIICFFLMIWSMTGTLLNHSIIVLLWWIPVYVNVLTYEWDNTDKIISNSLTLSLFMFILGVGGGYFSCRRNRNNSFILDDSYAVIEIEKKLNVSTLILVALFVGFFYSYYGSPLFSSNVDLAKIEFAKEHGIYLRFVKYMLPLLVFPYLILSEYKYKKYFVLFMWGGFVALIGHKGLVMTSFINLMIFSRINRIDLHINYKFLFLISVVWLFFLIKTIVGDQFGSLGSYLLFRLAHIDGLQIIYENLVPVHGIYYGLTILNEMASFLNLMGLYNGTSETTGMFIAREYNNNANYEFEIISPGAAHLYLNFGNVGVAIGSFILGRMFSYFLSQMYKSKKPTKRTFFYLVSLLPVFAFSLGKIGSLIVSDLFSYMLFFAFIVFLQIFIQLLVLPKRRDI